MFRHSFQRCIIILSCGFLGFASQSFADNFQFKQSGFSGGGEITIKFSGEDDNGGRDGVNGNLENPDGKIGFFDCKGDRPACYTYHADVFEKEMTFKLELSGSGLFERAKVALGKLQQQDFDETGFLDLDTNDFFLKINLGNFAVPSFEINITKQRSTVCEFRYDSKFNGTKQCETSTQLATISGLPAFVTSTPGSSAVLQSASTLKLNTAGLTSAINTPASRHETDGGLVDVPLSLPTAPQGAQVKLNTVTLVYDSPVKTVEGTKVNDPYLERAIVDRIEIWDGDVRLLSKQLIPWPKRDDLFEKNGTEVTGLGSRIREKVSIPGAIKFNGNARVSLHIVNQCTANKTCTAQKLTIIKVNAGFNP